jgi:hypothetical protein
MDVTASNLLDSPCSFNSEHSLALIALLLMVFFGFHLGNVLPNIGRPLFDCSRVASSWIRQHQV